MNLNTTLFLLLAAAAIGWGQPAFGEDAGAAADPGRLDRAIPALPVMPPATATDLPADPEDDAAWAPATTRLNGPADQCLDMVKAVMCPWLSRLPFMREIVGQFAVWGRTSCPTS